MNLKQQKQILILIAAATAVVCGVALCFFRTELFVRAGARAVNILMPFIYGAVIAYLLRPACRWVEDRMLRLTDPEGKGRRRGVVRMISILIALLLLAAVLGLLLMAVIPELVNSLSGILSQLPQTVARFETWLASMDNGEISHEIVSSAQNALDTLTEKLQSILQSDILPQLQSMVSGVTSSVKSLMNVLKNFGLGCIISAYLLGSWEKFGAQFKLITYALFPKAGADWIRREVRFADRMFSGFIHGKLLDSLIIGVICFLFMSIVRMPYAMLVSLIVGVTNIIPFFGPYLGAIPSFILILTVSPARSLIFLVFVIILQQFDGNILGPMILGDRLGLSGFWILFSILIFGSLWGLVGMLIGAPVFAVLYDLVRSLILGLLARRGQEPLAQEYARQYSAEKPVKK